MNRWAAYRVLITGAGGFIGRNLVEDQLGRGREVIALDLNTQSLAHLRQNSKLAILEGDFRDSSLLNGAPAEIDICFHLASIHLESGIDEDLFWAVNVEGAREFADWCRAADVKRFVHVSSVGVYGDLENPPANEDTDSNPSTAYARTKLEGEKQIIELARATRFPVVVVRPAWVYGPDCPRTLKLFGSVQKRWFFLVGDGSAWRHPIYIDDALEALELAATHPSAPGRTFIVAGPRAVTIRELVNEVATVCGVPPPSLRLPRALVWTGCAVLERGAILLGRQPPFSRRSLKFFTGNSAFDTTRVERALGFRPQIDLPEGLRRTSTAMVERIQAETIPTADPNRPA